MERKLIFQLVPEGCWYSNLRSVLTAEQWNYIKKLVKTRSGGRCAICGKRTDRLDAHEEWSYDEKTCTQKLTGIVGVCKDCHAAIHIGRTQLKGNAERAENHYMKVNNCSYAEMRRDLGEANDRHIRLNRVSEWRLDISYLKTFLEL